MTKKLLTGLVAAAVAASFVLVHPPVAHAETGTDLGTAVAPTSDSQTTPASTTTADTSGTVSTAAVPAWLNDLNTIRTRFGVATLTENATFSTDAVAHSKYMAMNGVVTHAEDPNQPYYSAAGNTSGMNSNVAAGWSTPSEFINAWASSPFHLIGMLDSRLRTTGYGQFTDSNSNRTAATLNVLQGRSGTAPTTGWPRTWPRGTTNIMELSDSSSPDAAYGCSAPSGSWYGQAIVVDFGPGKTVTNATASIQQNGVTIPVCVRVASNYVDGTAKSLMAGKALVIPMRPLVKNVAYTGTVTTNLGAAAINFDTGNPSSGVYGDHNGDGTADILAVSGADQSLLMYPTLSGPRLAAGQKVGTSWGGMTWISGVQDLNGDGRTELAARRSDGTLWLYQGLGRGLWGSATQIGRGFGGLDALTVVPDITGDRKPELIGRQAGTGALYRYSFTGLKTGLANTAQIGRGWGGIKSFFSVGDFSGDNIPDLIGIAVDGRLIRYAFATNGTFKSTTIVGRGWDSFTASWSPGDMNGDRRYDLVGRRSDGNLYFYANKGTAWGSAVQIGQGWNGLRLLA